MTRVRHGSERELLQAFIDQQRDVVLWKIDGLTDEQLRRPVGASRLYLLGIVKHLAAAEQYWLCELFGRPAEPLSLAATDDLQAEPGDTTDSVLAYYARARAASDAAIAVVDLDTSARTWTHDTVSFRFALLHMIEETARHAGHIDGIRQLLDGRTGYLPHDAPY
ncbi:DinB family protein [Microlunatus parietis]|uniref:Putative damage-inducible protein DinB n=1 Tax=Microlunatus parietis TaxID=682979 RepID=A0A7Y9I8Z8_9ACTN|nr:DinB family protein [Microlunatus parietis]NYE72536.1 putative damage-inducible protein DinB [Microlunatus parietis]